MNNMPTVTKNLLIINALVFVVTLLPLSTLDVTRDFGLYYFQSSEFHIYQLLTYMFVHSSQTFTHIFFNMFALWMFGRVMENVWGPRKFLFYYLLCGVGAGLTQELAQFLHVIIEGDAIRYIETSKGLVAATVRDLTYLTPTIGASGAVCYCESQRGDERRFTHQSGDPCYALVADGFVGRTDPICCIVCGWADDVHRSDDSR